MNTVAVASSKKSTLAIILAVIVVVLATAAYLFLKPQFVKKPQSQILEQSGEPTAPTTEDIIEKLDAVTNPVGGNVPELNPIEKTNPFKGVYKNPFQ